MNVKMVSIDDKKKVCKCCGNYRRIEGLSYTHAGVCRAPFPMCLQSYFEEYGDPWVEPDEDASNCECYIENTTGKILQE